MYSIRTNIFSAFSDKNISYLPFITVLHMKHVTRVTQMILTLLQNIIWAHYAYIIIYDLLMNGKQVFHPCTWLVCETCHLDNCFCFHIHNDTYLLAINCIMPYTFLDHWKQVFLLVYIKKWNMSFGSSLEHLFWNWNWNLSILMKIVL